MWNKTKALKRDLSSFKDEPLSKSSLLFLILLDLIILVNIIVVLEAEVSKVQKGFVYYPGECLSHFREDKVDYTDFDDGKSAYRYAMNDSVSPHCRELDKKIKVITASPVYKSELAKIRAIELKLGRNRQAIGLIQKKYDTRLLERIAQVPDDGVLALAKREYDSMLVENKSLEAQKALIKGVTTLAGYSAYKEYVVGNKDIYEKARRSYWYWVPFNEFANVLKYIVPLLLIFGYAYYYSKTRELRRRKYYPVVKIISAHTLLILMLPILYYLGIIIDHLLPNRLFQRFVDYLIESGLLQILNYLSIAIVVMLFGLIIYAIQRRSSRLRQEGKRRDVKKRISWSQCPHCDYKVDYTRPFCPFCGERLLEKCPHCDGLSIKGLPYCKECGESMPNGE